MKKQFYKKRNFIYGTVFLILTLVWTGVIFFQSMRIAEESSAQSGRVVQAVMNVAEAVGIEINDTDSLTHNIRKSAHFLEFAILGFLSFITLKTYKFRSYIIITAAFLYCLAAASADEYIQTFIEGRSGQISDVMLDCSGAATAIIICYLIVIIIKKRFIPHKNAD